MLIKYKRRCVKKKLTTLKHLVLYFLYWFLKLFKYFKYIGTNCKAYKKFDNNLNFFKQPDT